MSPAQMEQIMNRYGMEMLGPPIVFRLWPPGGRRRSGAHPSSPLLRAASRLRITSLLGHALTPEVERQLEVLLEADEGMYRISLLKHEPKDFSYGELRQEVERGKFFQPLFAFGQTFLASAGLSNESVKYYCSLVQFYTVYKLQRMAVPKVRLYLLCFASHRFRQINDNLIEAFIHLVDDYEQQAKIAAEIAAAESMAEATGNLQAAGQC